MRFISAEQVYKTLSMAACIDLMADTQADLSAGKIRIPLRQAIDAGNNGTLLMMPGSHPELTVSGVKVLTVYPDNPQASLPAIQGSIMLFDAENGTPMAMIDAASVTAIRTAAASGMATRVLANPDASALTILGCGVQAASHIKAICSVRDIETIRVWSRNPVSVDNFVTRHSGAAERVIAERDISRALNAADIICAVTGAASPLIHSTALRNGSHVNLVGAHSPESREADGMTLQRARVFTEVTEFALAESGDIRMAITEGYLDVSDIAREIGAVILQQIAGREDSEQITLYKSLGNIAQDLVAARYVFDQLTSQEQSCP